MKHADYICVCCIFEHEDRLKYVEYIEPYPQTAVLVARHEVQPHEAPMSKSMIDEEPVPPEPKLYVCPCCIFSFRQLEAFVKHCEQMKASIDKAVAKASK